MRGADMDTDRAAAGEWAMSNDVPETEIVQSSRVACDGGGAGLGHPRVWMQIPPVPGWVECGYCDKRYVLAQDAVDH